MVTPGSEERLHTMAIFDKAEAMITSAFYLDLFMMIHSCYVALVSVLKQYFGVQTRAMKIGL